MKGQAGDCNKHNTLNETQRIGRMSSRFAAMKTSLNALMLSLNEFQNEFKSLETEFETFIRVSRIKTPCLDSETIGLTSGSMQNDPSGKINLVSPRLYEQKSDLRGQQEKNFRDSGYIEGFKEINLEDEDYIERPHEDEVRKIRSLDLKLSSRVEIDFVILEIGNPGKFSLGLANQSYRNHLNYILKSVHNPGRVRKPQPDQAVLVWNGSSWCRACVQQVHQTTVSLMLVDDGLESEARICSLRQIPREVAEATPALSVTCSYNYCVSSEDTLSLLDWTRLVEGKLLRIHKVLDVKRNIVDLVVARTVTSIGDCLQFLGHLTVSSPMKVMFECDEERIPGSVGRLCMDQDNPSPDCLNFVFSDNPRLETRLVALQSLTTVVESSQSESPPGWVQVDSALLAPWENDFYRAKVLEVSCPLLTVLFVDYGNTSSVTWWKCRPLPVSYLFPPVTTSVRLAGIIPPVTGWNYQVSDLLKKILGEHSCKVMVAQSDLGGDSGRSIPIVDITVRWEGTLYSLASLLIHLGHGDSLYEVNGNIEGENTLSRQSTGENMISLLDITKSNINPYRCNFKAM